jgi:Holliday junction resolvasome RuvABC endonuclease subunit
MMMSLPMTTERVVLGLDPGSAFGWAKVGFPGSALLQGGVWTLQHGRLEGGGMMFVRLETWLLEVMAQLPTLVAIEDVKRHEGTMAAQLYGGITATVTRICEEVGVTYTGVPVGTWKKLATGKGNASKDAVRAAAGKWWPTAPMWEQDEIDAAFIGLTAGRMLGW